MPPKEATSSTGPATATRTTTGAAKPTKTTARAIRTSTLNITSVPTATGSSLGISPSATATAAADSGSSAGLSPGAIGGIAAGGVVLFALVGLLFYKRRKRAVASSKDGYNGQGGDGNEPMYMHASNYGKRKKGPSGISGPLALAPESDASPPPFPPPLVQQPKKPFNKHRGNAPWDNHAPPQQNDYYDDALVQDYYTAPDVIGAGSNNELVGAQRSPIQARDNSHGNLTPAPDYYLGKEDIDPRRDLRGLDRPEAYIHDKKSPPPQSPPPLATSPRNERYHNDALQRQDQDDSPRTSISSNNSSEYLTLEQAQKAHQQKMMGHKESIGSVNMLIKNATKDQQYLNQQQQRSNDLLSPVTPSFAPDHASMAISDSTMSMMPSLPSTSSPMSFIPRNNNNTSESRNPQSPTRSPVNHARQGSNPRIATTQPGKPSPSRGPDYGPLSPGYEDPYAESAYSEDFADSRSMISSTPNHGPYGGPSNGSQSYSPYSPQHGGSSSGPYSPGPSSRPYGSGEGYRSPNGQGYGMPPPPSPYMGNGYGGRGPPPQHMRGPGGPGYGRPGPDHGYGPGPDHGYGPGPGPGYGPPGPGRAGPPPNYFPQNGYPGRVTSPGPGYGPGGYRPHPPRDPEYSQGPYQQAY
ncbi:hypothetical protein BC939DRAFT_475786 [Gamsiella multidivaricata]|uniref:uncharacterized protein n=1 Tax=Gamsiella multidivaricata TaxID=101098 RepID=UPI00221E5659|nr:uncharacterized protein BC939DRAFT_475786 [Gamsiella multidivaricata]KAG0357146.1 hypothetical protein BGZ54_000440 [Gamsiella multidivaricata]KAI7826591.1 hypothetical protein BC939DRAFT_475786 [Gamsiella multidivaricata]